MKLWSLLALLVVTSGRARAEVIVVAPTGIPSTIQAAVDVARDGDVILVKSGTYPSFVVRGKALVIAEDVGQVVRVAGTIRIERIDGTRTVTLLGLESVGGTVTSTANQYGLRVLNSSGLVFVQDCTLRASLVPTTDTTVITQPRPALLVERSLSVVLTRCTLIGSTSVRGQSPLYPTANLPYCSGVPSEGAYLVNSGVSFFECDVSGGPGRTADTDGSHGAHGIWAVGSALFLCRSAVTGGNGASASCDQWSCTVGSYGGDGGYGVLAAGGTACITRTASLAGGTRGIACGSFNCESYPGGSLPPVRLLDTATLTTQPSITQAFIGTSILREDKHGQLSFVCDVGAAVNRYSSRDGIASYDPVTESIQVTGYGPSFRDSPVGVGAGAPLVDPITGVILPPGIAHRLLYYQCVQTTPQGLRLGTPRVVLTLDSAY